MGGREPVVPNRDILEVLADSPDPVMSASEVAEHLPINDAGVYKRLRELESKGAVASKKAGQARVWWLAGTTWHRPDVEDALSRL